MSTTLTRPNDLAAPDNLDLRSEEGVASETSPPESPEAEPSGRVYVEVAMRLTESEADQIVNLSGRVVVRRETFFLEVEDDEIRLTHPRWSLMGSGASFLEAEKDLMREAAELAALWADKPASEMSREALRLRDYAMQFLGIQIPE